MRHDLLFLVALSTLATSCATTESGLRQQGLKPATASEISQSLIGNTLVGKTAGQDAFEVLYRPDGTGVFRASAYVEKGFWRVTEDGLLCARWARLRDGAEACNRQYLNGENNMAFSASGQHTATYKIVPGNPGKL